MKLYVDIGNSAIKWATDVELCAGKQHRAESAKLPAAIEEAWLELERPEAVYIASVRQQDIDTNLLTWIQQQWRLTASFAQSRQREYGVTNGYQQPDQLGVDRWLALIAARALSPLPKIVVDCGSATTIDAMDGEGQHIGGIILPGFRFESKDINQIYAAVGFQTPGMREKELLPAFEIAATVLGGSKSSRLYRRMLEREKLVSAISSWHMELRSAGLFGIDTIFRPGREREVNQFLFEEINDVIEKGIGEEELARAKSMLRSGFLYENETNAALSGTMGYYEIGFGDASVAMEYLQALENITREDVRRVMNDYIADKSFVRVVVGPDETRE